MATTELPIDGDNEPMRGISDLQRRHPIQYPFDSLVLQGNHRPAGSPPDCCRDIVDCPMGNLSSDEWTTLQATIATANIKSLTFHGFDIGAAGLECLSNAFSANPSIHILKFWSCRNIPSTPFRRLLEILQECPGFSTLRIIWGNLDDQAWTALGEYLTNTNHLKILDLGSSTVTPDGCKAIAEELAQNHSLETFRAGDFPPAGYVGLSNSFRTNKTLKTVDLSHSKNLDKASWEALADAFCVNQTVDSLSFFGSEVSSDGWKAIARIVSTNKSISKLNLGHFGATDISQKPWSAMEVALMSNLTITELSMYAAIAGFSTKYCEINQDISKMFAEVVIYNQTLQRVQYRAPYKSSREEIEAKIGFFLNLNRGGREKLLKDDEKWLETLASFSHDVNVAFYFLSMRPDIFGTNLRYHQNDFASNKRAKTTTGAI